MRTAAVAILLALFGLSASESALARKVLPPGASAGGGGGQGGHPGGGHHGGHHHHGTFVGFGWSSWWYPPPYYYYPVPVVYPAQPVTYVEQGSAPAPDQAWWYYCDAENAYYPHVKTCPAGWQRVPPAPPPQ